jgi:hypothetical protein
MRKGRKPGYVKDWLIGDGRRSDVGAKGEFDGGTGR